MKQDHFLQRVDAFPDAQSQKVVRIIEEHHFHCIRSEFCFEVRAEDARDTSTLHKARVKRSWICMQSRRLSVKGFPEKKIMGQRFDYWSLWWLTLVFDFSTIDGGEFCSDRIVASWTLFFTGAFQKTSIEYFSPCMWPHILDVSTCRWTCFHLTFMIFEKIEIMTLGDIFCEAIGKYQIRCWSGDKGHKWCYWKQVDLI